MQSRNSCNLNCSGFEESEQGAHRIVLEVQREGHGEDRGRSTADPQQLQPQGHGEDRGRSTADAEQ